MNCINGLRRLGDTTIPRCRDVAGGSCLNASLNHQIATSISAFLLFCVSAFLIGCGNSDGPPVPPQILLGQQECDHCRMIISDERFAAAMVIEHADGSRSSPAFDDVNCLVDFERECDDACVVLARYVHDVNTRQWLDASKATFVMSDSIQTPMASGVAAAATREGLTELQREHNATWMDFGAVQAHFTPASDRHVEGIEMKGVEP